MTIRCIKIGTIIAQGDLVDEEMGTIIGDGHGAEVPTGRGTINAGGKLVTGHLIPQIREDQNGSL